LFLNSFKDKIRTKVSRLVSLFIGSIETLYSRIVFVVEGLNSIEDIKVLKEFLILFPISCSINSKSVSIFF
jgi:hypothetical protein